MWRSCLLCRMTSDLRHLAKLQRWSPVSFSIFPRQPKSQIFRNKSQILWNKSHLVVTRESSPASPLGQNFFRENDLVIRFLLGLARCRWRWQLIERDLSVGSERNARHEYEIGGNLIPSIYNVSKKWNVPCSEATWTQRARGVLISLEDSRYLWEWHKRRSSCRPGCPLLRTVRSPWLEGERLAQCWSLPIQCGIHGSWPVPRNESKE